MYIHHIGIIVSNIEKSIAIYNNLGYCQSSEPMIDNVQFNKIVFLSRPNDSQNIELIEPIDERSSVCHFKCGYHHMCFIGETGENVIDSFKKMKIGKIFTKPIIAPALNYKKVVFACLQNDTFIELILNE